jgi:hypothetical protein
MPLGWASSFQPLGWEMIPSSCPSPSGEGTQGPSVRARPLNRATGPKVMPLGWASSSLNRCGRMSASFHHKARRSPPGLSPRKGRKRGVERKQRQPLIPLPIYPPCPSLSRELRFIHNATKREPRGWRTAFLTGSPSFLSPRAAPDHDLLRRGSRQRGSRHEGSL